MPDYTSTLPIKYGGEKTMEKKVVLVPTEKDFALIKGKVKNGMQMRCGGICSGTCHCKHFFGTDIRTRN